MRRNLAVALEAIRLDGDVLTWMVTALKASHSDTKRYHNEMITALQKQYQKLQHRLDAMYVDKLDGTISQAFFDQKSSEWRSEQADILRKIEQHQRANQTYVDEGVRLLELAQRAIKLYERQEMREKRRLLDFVFSNSSGGTVISSPPTANPLICWLLQTRRTTKKKPLSGDLTAFLRYGSPGRTRTSDQLVNSQPLYRLSYRGIVPDIIPYSDDSSRVKCQRAPSISRN